VPAGVENGGTSDERCNPVRPDQVERLDDLSDRPRRLSGSKLLWVDIDRASDETADRVAEAFGLDDGTRECLANSNERAIFNDHGRYIHVTTYAASEEDEGKLISLECVVGENWVVTAHDEPVPCSRSSPSEYPVR
jgi:Mg2+ and Co2+ transporter CorA